MSFRGKGHAFYYFYFLHFTRPRFLVDEWIYHMILIDMCIFNFKWSVSNAYTRITADILTYIYRCSFLCLPWKELKIKKISKWDEINSFEDTFDGFFYLVVIDQVPQAYCIFRHMFCSIAVIWSFAGWHRRHIGTLGTILLERQVKICQKYAYVHV